MKNDKLQISTRTSGDKSMIDIRIPSECVMIDKNGKAFVDPDFIHMIQEVMANGGHSEYEMQITDLRETNKIKKRNNFK
ncbi:MAG: hypothetical protein KBD76_15250 [Bacteriovorax sp.]|nr:hypothetical protein [Bacteriovorax sp.]